MFTSPHSDTMILPIKTMLKLTGVGEATSDLMLPLIYSVLDVNGGYVVLHDQAVYYLPTPCLSHRCLVAWVPGLDIDETRKSSSVS